MVARSNALAAVDAGSGTTWLLGGRSDRLLDLWRLQNGAWQKVASPFSGTASGLAYDVARQRLVAAMSPDGGTRGLYEFDGVSWHLALTLTTTGTTLHYDAPHQTMWVWSTTANGGATLAQWNGTNLTFVPPTGLSPFVVVNNQFYGTLALDTARGRVVVVRFGLTQTVFEWDGTVWTTITNPPGAPYSARLATDPIGGAVLAISFQPSPVVQMWTGTAWAAAPSPGCPARSDSTIVGNAARQVLQVVGGTTNDGLRADTWENPGGTWQLVAEDNPLPRVQQPQFVATGSGTALVFDSQSRTVRYDHGAWTLLQPAHAPPPRGNFALAGDPSTGRAFLFGGENGGGLLADFWLWDGADWQQLPGGPAARSGHGLCYRGDVQRVVLHGGAANYETWEWDGSVWSLRSATFPPHNGAARLDWHAVRHRVVLTTFGLNGLEMWEWDGVNWLSTNPPNRPTVVGGMQTTYDPVRESIVLIEARYGYPTEVPGAAWEWDGGTWTALGSDPRLNGFMPAVAGLPDVGIVVLNDIGAYATTLVHDHPASATSFGSACPDPQRVLTATHPWLGQTYRARYPLTPGSAALFATGFSDTTAGGLPLPADLGFAGLPGCALRVSAEAIDLRLGNGEAELAIALPNTTALIGIVLYQQAASLSTGLDAVSQGLVVTLGSLW